MSSSWKAFECRQHLQIGVCAVLHHGDEAVSARYVQRVGRRFRSNTQKFRSRNLSHFGRSLSVSLITRFDRDAQEDWRSR